MFAAVLESLHQPVRYQSVEKPVAGAGEVVVRLKAAALNHRDLWIQKGLYPGIVLPVVLGSDGSGVVTEAGDEASGKWLDKEVILNPAHNWGDHPAFYGSDFRILGLEDPGTFAQYVRIPTRYLSLKPAHLSFEQAAALPMGGLTAWRALLTKAKLAPGEKVLVTGAGGGVALFVVQFAVAMGAEVWVTSGSEEKIQQAIALGARGGINYKNPTWFRDLLIKVRAPRHGYFKVIIDSAGGPGFQRLIDLAAPGGRICLYGGTVGNITDIVPAKVFFKQLSILGTMMGTETEFEAMTRFIETHQLQPVIDSTYALEDAESALRHLDSGQQFGKIVLTIR